MDNTEKTFQQRVKLCYVKLRTSRLVKKHDCDEEALGFFQNFLNLALAQNELEMTQIKIFKELYHNCSRQFLNMINYNKQSDKVRKYILLTDSNSIERHFGLSDFIKIQWNNETKQYSVASKEAISLQVDKKESWADL